MTAGGWAGDDPRKVGSGPGPDDEDANSRRRGVSGKGHGPFRRSVGRCQKQFMGDMELLQNFRRLAHDGKIGIASHDDADDRYGLSFFHVVWSLLNILS
jgi:hypothetical protein